MHFFLVLAKSEIAETAAACRTRPKACSRVRVVKACEEGWPPSPQLGPQIARERDAGDLGEREGQQREWTLAEPFLRSRRLSNPVTWRSKPAREICSRCAVVCLWHERCSLIVAAFVEKLDVVADAPRCATLSRAMIRCCAQLLGARKEHAAVSSTHVVVLCGDVFAPKRPRRRQLSSRSLGTFLAAIPGNRAASFPQRSRCETHGS